MSGCRRAPKRRTGFFRLHVRYVFRFPQFAGFVEFAISSARLTRCPGAHQIYDKVGIDGVDAGIEISSSEVVVNDISGHMLFRYGLDLVPFASCDAADPTKIYFVTAPTDGHSMLHLFAARSHKLGLEYTFTMAQAFHVRWSNIGTAAGMPGRRCTSPTGAIGLSSSTPRERRAKSPPASLGTHPLEPDASASPPTETVVSESDPARCDSDYLTIEYNFEDDTDL